MYLWILFVALTIISVLLGIKQHKIFVSNEWSMSDWRGVTSAISGILAAFLLTICIVYTIQVPGQINNFNAQSEYVETYIPKNDVENAALTNKKIELNDWLYNVKYWNAHFGNWQFYPNSVQNMEPIN